MRSNEEGKTTIAARRRKKMEIWTQKLQFVTLNGDKIEFYSVEVDQSNYNIAVRYCSKSDVCRDQIMSL